METRIHSHYFLPPTDSYPAERKSVLYFSKKYQKYILLIVYGISEGKNSEGKLVRGVQGHDVLLR